MGAAMGNGFCNAGANVVMTGTKTPEDLTTDIPNYPQNIRYHQLDYSDNKSVKEFIYSVNKLERVDALINNAGVNKIETITEISNGNESDKNNMVIKLSTPIDRGWNALYRFLT